ncbi:GNAT superfamily N-acetyltransferase [Nakamurella sp. UYEF19]|uniref:GNAT family N-acetyltransferase n=1 Tax=Nakamurella sp. UYEF19 TaxID=1756392 RepID=UPI003398FDEF
MRPGSPELAAFAHDSRAWVSTDEADLPVAYLLVEIVDGDAHIEQVSVHPEHAHRRIGQSLIEVAADWAARQALAALTLTTYAEVPWNAPYYERLGFRILHDADLGGGLRYARRLEAARGLDRWPRVAMRLDIGSDSLQAANSQEPL